MISVLSSSLVRVAPLLRLLAVLVGLLSVSPVHAARTIDIGVARGLPLGTVVTVKGSVTVPSGLFVSSTFDQGFAIQDKSGGIYVSVASDPGLRVREQVEVTGQLADSYGLLILVPSSLGQIKHKGHGPPVSAEPLATGSVNEDSEGLLVTVHGVITQAVSSDLPYGYKLYINDGSGEIQIFVAASAGLDLSGLAVGQRVCITGFSAQFDTTYEVQPRFQSDLHSIH